MALDPIRYVMVPKLYAILLCLPLLTIIAIFLGIMGGVVTAIFYLDLSITSFYNQVLISLTLKDILTGLFKSLFFAYIILCVGCYSGLRARGGSEGVGIATTKAVVASIFLGIVADSILGLVFYFKG
jgi:phospholipid/cholesterol/gamma-HCH transport system permease protein